MEPTVEASIISPKEHMLGLMQLCDSKRGHVISQTEMSGDRVLLKYVLPLQELAGKLYT